jgi:hypothetical protein
MVALVLNVVFVVIVVILLLNIISGNKSLRKSAKPPESKAEPATVRENRIDGKTGTISVQERTEKKMELRYYQSIKIQLNEYLITLNGEIEYNQNFLRQFSYGKKLIFLNDKRKNTLGRLP